MQHKQFYKEIKTPVKISPQRPTKPRRPLFSLFKNRIRYVMMFVAILSASLGITLWYFWEEPLQTPLSSLSSFQFLNIYQPTKKSNKIVYGFLPYWNLADVTIQPEITHLAYFSLTIGADGEIITKEGLGAEPGYNKLNSEKLMSLANQVYGNQDNIEIVLSQFNNDDIVSLINNPQSHQNLISSLDSILLAYPISGINIDIEYSGEITDKLRNNFVTLVTTVRDHLKKRYSHVQLSIDMYASAAEKKLIWDVEKIEPQVDYVIVMAYDFHRRSSINAGPVAPLFGGEDLWESDINHHLRQFLKVVPKEKILLGVPFYGYEWQTTSADALAQTFPDTGSTASYKRVLEIFDKEKELNVKQYWHDVSLTPYLTYEEDGEIFVIHYENSRSLSYKFDYVKQLDLAGIAIWALGYEGSTRGLWEAVRNGL